MSFVNQLEPQSLLDAFMASPPDGFRSMASVQGTPAFLARFDLLTTAEPELQRRIRSWPGYRWWSRLLRPRTCFIGSTVTEYAWLPASVEPDQLARALTDRHAREQAFLIVKDLPVDSPLLDQASNTSSARLSAALEQQGFVLVEGQALAWVPIDFDNEDAYLARLSRGARRDIRRKLRVRDGIDIEVLPTGSPAFEDEQTLARLFDLYQRVFEQSEIHFDRLDADFFRSVFRDGDSGGVVFVYRHDGHMLGWNLCYQHAGNLVDKYVGFEYPQAREHNLYVVSWMHNLDYARRMGLRNYIAGWTDPEVKAHLGARFTFTRHAVRPRSRLLRLLLKRLSHHFESDRQWFEEHAR
ncbi:MAG: GNAT family N-acetyltransferase [Rhodanobacteraceae bacterium]